MFRLNNNFKIKLKCFIQFSELKNFSTNHQNLNKYETVKLSYNSYETTNTKSESHPLVVMHGLFGSKQNWKSLCKAIQQKSNPYRKVIAVDARNHGESPHTDNHSYEHMAEDIRDILKELNIPKATIMGHSMGGRAMMYFALKYPELVHKAIIVDISPITTSTSLTGMSTIFEAMQSIRIPDGVSMHDGRKAANYKLGSTVDIPAVRDFLLTNLVRSQDGVFSWRINLDVLQDSFSNKLTNFPEDALTMKYAGPVLFIGGSNSDYIAPDDLPKYQKMFPKSKLVMVEGSGHWVHSEKPAEFLKICLEFLNENEN